MSPKRVLLAGGGSGGHIMPHISLVTALERVVPGNTFLYLGSRNPVDRRIVESHLGGAVGGDPFPANKRAMVGLPLGQGKEGLNIRFVPIFTGKFRRYFSLWHFLDPFLILLGFLQSFFWVARFWPDVIFVTGGFVSLPVVFAGFLLRRRIVLQENDSAMGLSNRIAARLASHVVTAFPDVYPSPKTTWAGMPLRPDILEGDPQKGWELTGLKPGKPVLLVMGGSLGAQFINDRIVDMFPLIRDAFQVVHITGASKSTPLAASGYVQFTYLDQDLKHVYAITDIILARSGANTLAELALIKKPALLIPLPGSAQDNQLKNALFYADRGAALILEQKDAAADRLTEALLGLIRDTQKQAQMRQVLSGLATPEAADRIAGILLRAS